jgi:hypothetical protein
MAPRFQESTGVPRSGRITRAWAVAVILLIAGGNFVIRDAMAAAPSLYLEPAFFSAATLSLMPALQDTTLRGSGAPTRRARALLRKRQTTLGAEQPVSTQSILDSIKALPRDSSARLEQFHHVRVDPPMVKPFSSPIHSLYLPEPTLVRTQHQLDTARYVYRIRRMVGGADVKEPLVYS